ncbi:MAG TPA: SRPBCC family protein [Kofleriaceae bacterium]|nr:SRPBCC family protein [Kofleriaceae bacterium]
MAALIDRIEKEIVLAAPLSRVWAAIGDAQQFGQWFGARFDGPFEEGKDLSGTIQPTTVDPEVAKQQQPYAGTPFTISVVRVEEMRRLAFRWHPGPPGADPAEPTTLVELELSEVPGGTRLLLTESGFDRLPPGRRVQAFTGNEAGWEHQLRLIQAFLHAA